MGSQQAAAALPDRTSPSSPPPVRVLIVGCSYGGVAAAVNLLDLGDGLSPRQAREPYRHHGDAARVPFEITIVDERDGYYHVIGTPLAFADAAYASKAWVKSCDIPALQRPEVRLVRGSVEQVDCRVRRARIAAADGSGETSEVDYDFLVAASGLRREWPVVPRSATRKAFLLEAEEQIHAVSNATEGVVVVGGGAVGIEMAAELKLAQPHVKVTLVHSRDRLMSAEALPDECKDVALELLREAGVEVLLNARVAKTTKTTGGADGKRKSVEIEFADGTGLVASEVVMAVSRSVPSTGFLPNEAVDEEGYVKILPSLQFSPGTVPNAACHFAVGDAALWSGIKRCGAAMHMGYYAAVNIHQLVLERTLAGKQQPPYVPEFLELEPVPPMIGLAVGRKAVACGPEIGTISGEDVMEAYFRDDLGFGICWDYMQMGIKKAAAP